MAPPRPSILKNLLQSRPSFLFPKANKTHPRTLLKGGSSISRKENLATISKNSASIFPSSGILHPSPPPSSRSFIARTVLISHHPDFPLPSNRCLVTASSSITLPYLRRFLPNHHLQAQNRLSSSDADSTSPATGACSSSNGEE